MNFHGFLSTISRSVPKIFYHVTLDVSGTMLKIHIEATVTLNS